MQFEKIRFYQRRHTKRMNSIGFVCVPVFLHPDDIPYIKAFINIIQDAIREGLSKDDS